MNRNVQFWRIVNGAGEELPGTFPANALVTLLEQAENRGMDRHLECRNGMMVLAHAGGNRPLPTVLLDKVRRENFPSVGNSQGQRSRIPLGSDEGLLEPTYFSFLPNNVVAVLVGGHGPHAQRLSEYLQIKFATSVSLQPVLRHDMDRILQEMRLTQIELAIPAENIDRDLIGGDWVQALDGASTLTHEGVIRIGLSVGRSGGASYKESFSNRLKELVSHLREATGIGVLKTARVSGVHNGQPQFIDLINDKFVERVEVDSERINDPEKAVEYAKQVLSSAADKSREFLERTVPPTNSASVTLGDFNPRTSRS
ncbi:hypothetical protein [Glutamicibacter uratoxydans]|uniref:hypothetical protein n=1 Tax=Glutamicibacter uratoxydans TaxID=43667 RepID=UPI003D6E583A